MEMLFLRVDQAFQLLGACVNLKEVLAIRYFLFNGLSPMELANARIEHLDPVTRELYFPKRHWKRNCVTDIDAETVRLQIIYTGYGKKGPLITSYKTKGHFTPKALWRLVKTVASRTGIPNKEMISPLILKRTFARTFLRTPGNTISGLQRAFSHKHLWSTAHYLRFDIEDVKVEKARMMERISQGQVFA